MGILSWIILGLIAGSLAKFILPGNDSGGLIKTSLLGIVGALVGGYVGSAMGWSTSQSFSLNGVLTATLGAIIVVVVGRFLS